MGDNVVWSGSRLMTENGDILEYDDLGLTQGTGGLGVYQDADVVVKAGGTAITAGTGGNVAINHHRYVQIGKNVTGRVLLTLGASGRVVPSGNFTVPLPVTPAAYTQPLGTGYFTDQSDSAKIYLCAAVLIPAFSETEGTILIDGGQFAGGTNPASDTVPFAFGGEGDVIAITYEYEAA